MRRADDYDNNGGASTRPRDHAAAHTMKRRLAKGGNWGSSPAEAGEIAHSFYLSANASVWRQFGTL